MDSRLEQVLSYLDVSRFPDVLMVGIWGGGGIGKTTIAREVFDRIRFQFECCSFLGNVREAATLPSSEQGLVHLQQRLLADMLGSEVNINSTAMGRLILSKHLRHKRVLIIVDDASDRSQLESLCDRDWFGYGSRIIVTSRDENLLNAFRVDKLYKVEALNMDESLQLFSRVCFGKDQIGEDFLYLSEQIVKYADGLPLAIKVLGSSLRLREKSNWSSALHQLHNGLYPNEKIISVLKVSYDGLDAREQEVFLDIACFFNGEDINRVTRILGLDDYYPDRSIKILIEKSLVTLDGTKLRMPDMTQKMGWEIVRRESPSSPERRSRLWLHEDIIHVLEHKEATSAIEGILLNLPEPQEVHLTSDPFKQMRRLRFLKIHNVNFTGKFEHLSDELRLLDWRSYPLKSLPSNFEADWLVELIMHSSHIKQLWNGVKRCRMLKLIDLRYSERLIETPDFSGVPELETLVLEGCTSLVTVHPSIGFLEKLALLNMRNCISVERLPPLRLKSLEILIVSGCSRMKDFPNFEGDMRCLLELHLDGTAIEEVPESVARLTALSLLNLEDCKKLYRLPRAIKFMTPLKTTNVTGCSNLINIPEDLGSLESLEELDISGTATSSNLKYSDYSPSWLESCGILLLLVHFFIHRELRVEGDIPDYGSISSVGLEIMSDIAFLLGMFFSISYLKKILVMMDIRLRSMRSTSRVSSLPSCAYSTTSLPLTHHIEEIVHPHSERRGNEAETVISELHSPIEMVQEESELETRNVKENVVIEEDKSAPGHLEGLFLYGCLFPENFEFRKHELVLLWIAEGLDMKESEQETMEDAGIKHFNTLESRGFFIRSRCDPDLGFDSVFSVPMYSPASFLYRVNQVELSHLSSAEFFRGMDGKLNGASESTTKHLSLIYKDDSDEKIFGDLSEYKNLRTLLLFSGHGSSIKRVPADSLLSLKKLTTLNLSRTLISGLPSSIGDVETLRYLDVSYTLITRLPSSIGSLINLQTLKLRGCEELFDLPRSVHGLTSLRHLDFDILRQLDSMPAHLGKLRNLQSLSAFLVGRDDGRRIGELKTLNDLGGALRICRLENVSSRADAEEVDLKSKTRLQRLDLRWTKLMDENNKMQEDILNAFQPPEGLKELQILFYNGTKLPSWLSNTSITDLVLITLYKCANCEILPSLGRLPKLKFLSIVEMNKVREIDQTFFRSSDHQEPFTAFPALEILEIDIMLNLKDWKEVKEGDLESLIKLTMESCPELVTVPSFSCLRSLKYIEFNHCPKLLSLDRNSLPASLASLIIRDCPELKEWCPKEGHQDLEKLVD